MTPEHGTPTGYDAGCHGAAECTNHRTELMTCAEAWTRYRGDYSYQRAVDAGTATSEKEVFLKIPVRQVAVKPAPRLRTARVPKVKAAPVPRAPIVVLPPEHGTLDGYWKGGCFREDTCPSTPSCAAVNLANVNGVEVAPVASPRALRPARVPRARRVRAFKPVQHGKNAGFSRGCTSETECPNLATGGPSCMDAHRAYHRDYAAGRRAGNGPAIKHGTATGYANGCHDRVTCPGGADGVKCSDASLAAEERRRREAGCAEKRPVVDSGPVRAHIALLRERGMGVVQIAVAAGVSKTSLKQLVYGRGDYTPDGPGPRHGEIAKHVDREKAEKVFAVTGPPPRVVRAKHGTRAGYRALGCRSRTACPAMADGDPSCFQANSAYNSACRDARASRELAA